MMVCLSRALARGLMFAARQRRLECARRSASPNLGSYSTRTAPHIPGMEYQDAICALNTLQTNASVLEQVRQDRGHPQTQMQEMRACLNRAGLTVEELDHLNIIHVTGTKGKGSTCAFTEQILRNYGFRTGFYSSPHLVQARERIRIDGQPIAKELFAKYFWQVYGRLDETKDANEGTMPAYFRFLTIMAFHVFLQEKVDVAVIEVGIGGAYDCTNIIRAPWVCGIASLGIDHTHVLGETIDLIAWQKGGIFKPGVPAFTVRQPEDAMSVLKDRARELQCSLRVCPELGDYQVDGGPLRLGLAGQHQHSNASLALQLTHTWLQRRCLTDNYSSDHVANGAIAQAAAFKPSPTMVTGLAETVWLGRNQILKHGAVTYFLDGAHTVRSMQACVQWFTEAAEHLEKTASGTVCRVLLFNATGKRDSAAMLKLLMPCQFDFAVFCPNIAQANETCNADQQNYNLTLEKMLTRSLDNEQSWRLLNGPGDVQGPRLLIEDVPDRRAADTLIFPCILSALQWITQGRDPVLADQPVSVTPAKASLAAKAAALRQASQIHVLVCGSLYLVGGALKNLDPDASK